MEALDGNAIGGQLLELFGREMTVARGACAYCGAPARIAELAVYMRAPVIVLVTVRRTTCVDVAGFRLESIS
jgi:hypothetical protein